MRTKWLTHLVFGCIFCVLLPMILFPASADEADYVAYLIQALEGTGENDAIAAAYFDVVQLKGKARQGTEATGLQKFKQELFSEREGNSVVLFVNKRHGRFPSSLVTASKSNHELFLINCEYKTVYVCVIDFDMFDQLDQDRDEFGTCAVTQIFKELLHTQVEKKARANIKVHLDKSRISQLIVINGRSVYVTLTNGSPEPCLIGSGECVTRVWDQNDN